MRLIMPGMRGCAAPQWYRNLGLSLDLSRRLGVGVGGARLAMT